MRHTCSLPLRAVRSTWTETPSHTPGGSPPDAVYTPIDGTSITSLSDAEEAAVGVYALETVNGGGLPASAGRLVSSGVPDGCPIFVDSGGFELSDDRSYEVWFNVRSVCPPPPQGNGTVADEVRQIGKWKLNGTALELSDKSGTSYNYDSDVSVNGNAISASVQIDWAVMLPRMATVFRR